MKRCRVDKENSFKIVEHETSWEGTEEIHRLSEEKLKKKARKIIEKNLKELSEAQELLYASNKYSLLLIFQAMDAAGKDGTIKHVMSGINPQGCEVYSFKKPSAEELDHDYLWRYNKRMPEYGRIGIFNRSYYEEVLVVKVHPELLSNPNPDETFWNVRYEDIRNMEKHLTRSRTVIIKLFLNVSKEEQRRRFLERLNTPAKHWKFSVNDLAERKKWDDYQKAFEDAINATATPWAPWYVIPADNKWIMRMIVSTIITETIQSLNLEPPKVSDDMKKVIDEARRELEKE
ncbi:MAG: polyphosphate kinase 2 family protein [Chlorobi bacterium]|nr:polyphosphate kinase 2 family protein [Chlorobiota bacterium]